MDEQVAAARLRAERAEAEQRLAAMASELDAVAAAAAGSNLDDEHDPEGATVAFEREQLSALRELARHQLVELDAALERLGAGRYGQCEACGQDIGAARLEALPATRWCVKCAARQRH